MSGVKSNFSIGIKEGSKNSEPLQMEIEVVEVRPVLIEPFHITTHMIRQSSELNVASTTAIRVDGVTMTASEESSFLSKLALYRQDRTVYENEPSFDKPTERTFSHIYFSHLSQIFSQRALGEAYVHVYCPESAHEILRVAGGKTVAEKIGRRTMEVVDTLQFNGSSQQAINRRYSGSGFRVISETDFYDTTGKKTSAPTEESPGVFATEDDKEVYGVLMVSYTLEFSLWLVKYMPATTVTDNLKLTWYMGKSLELSPVYVYAFAPGFGGCSTSFQRSVNPTKPDFQKVEQTADRKFVKKRIKDSKNPNNYIDIAVPTQVSFSDENGKKMTLRLPDDKKDTIMDENGQEVKKATS